MNHLAEHTVPGLHTSIAEVVLNLSSLRYDSRILDLGAGSGAFLNRLAGLGFCQLWGIDIAPSTPMNSNINFFKMDLEHPNPAIIDGQFELITAIEVVEHIENIGNLLEFIRLKLSFAGHLLLTTPNIYSMTCRARFLIRGSLKGFDSKGDRTHLFPVCIHTFQRCLKKRGLSILSLWTYPKHGCSLVATRKLILLSNFLAIFLRNPLPGDSLCMLIGHNKS